MKNRIVMVILLSMILGIFTACGLEKNKFDKEKNDASINCTYDIEELVDYFCGKSLNDSFFTKPDQCLSYNDVIEKFPGATTRTEGYSVYAVKQGGYYYVFYGGED